MADGNAARQPRKMTALDEYKLRLIGDRYKDAKRAPTLGFAIVKNQPHINVRTNVDGDKDYGRITAKMDTPTFFALLDGLRAVIDGPNDNRYVVKNKTTRFIGGKRSDPMPDTQVLVGKDKDGVVFIAVTSWEKERPIIKFPFRPTEWHHFSKGDGSALSLAEVSVLYANGFLKLLHGIIPHLLATEYVEPPPREGGNSGGGYGGGNNSGRQQQTGGGRQRDSGYGESDNASSDGDDWPM